MVSLLPRPSPRRKCAFTDPRETEADLALHSEVAGMNKAVNTGRTGTWPTQGGLQSIGNAVPFRGQIPALPGRNSVLDTVPPRVFNAVPIKPDLADMNVNSKTPSPQKQPTIKVGSASGKENLNLTVTPQSTR